MNDVVFISGVFFIEFSQRDVDVWDRADAVHHPEHVQRPVPAHPDVEHQLQVQGDPPAQLRVPGPAAAHLAHALPGEARPAAPGGHPEGHLGRRPRGQGLRQESLLGVRRPFQGPCRHAFKLSGTQPPAALAGRLITRYIPTEVEQKLTN